MPITCQVCNTTFEKIIPWQHLKTHGMNSAEYKERFGPLYSPETLSKFKDRVPHNKGKKVSDPTQLSNHRIAIEKREEKYRRGELIKRGGTRWSAEQKAHISEKIKAYAAENPDKMKERASLAIATKRKSGHDFTKPMKGKTHSEETKEKIRLKSIETNKKKTERSHQRILTRIHEAKLSVTNSLYSDTLELTCNVCQTKFTFSKQYFMAEKKFKLEACPTCFPRITRQSAAELEIFNFIHEICSDAISGYRETYHSKEIDIFVPSLKIGFEYNGLYYHSEGVLVSLGKSPSHDSEKRTYFLDKGIRVIQIFADEWQNKKEIVKSRIKNILGSTPTKIYARKCKLSQVSSKDASQFCDENHIMGKGRSNVRLGLYYEGRLVSLMTFTNNNISRKSSLWEINRFASLKDCTVVGGASRLFKEFLKLTNPDTVISYADNRWSTGDLYAKLGFLKVSNGTPNYWYTLPNVCKRFHRFSLRKNKDDDQKLTEYENRAKAGYARIWDCGSSKWVWTRK